jgi:hypothetical protein
MEILAHRGLWKFPEERNTLTAFKLALNFGFGIELDVRDLNGSIVISHDIPVEGSVDLLSTLLEMYSRSKFSSCLALNIKSDGLQKHLAKLLSEFNINNYFIFDMSIPDTLGYFRSNLETYIRISDIEEINPFLMDSSQGIWLDGLMGEWVQPETILALANYNKPICLVSPELHKRDFLPFWESVKQAIEAGVSPSLLKICTDLPKEAGEYFK